MTDHTELNIVVTLFVLFNLAWIYIAERYRRRVMELEALVLHLGEQLTSERIGSQQASPEEPSEEPTSVQEIRDLRYRELAKTEATEVGAKLPELPENVHRYNPRNNVGKKPRTMDEAVQDMMNHVHEAYKPTEGKKQ